MRTVIFGQKIKNIYWVENYLKDIKDEKGNTIQVYTDKPRLIVTRVVDEWVELCSYDGEPRFNSPSPVEILWEPRTRINMPEFNISEDETVVVEHQIFRADLNEMHLRTSKIIEEIDVDKENSEICLKDELKKFNKMMISSNKTLKSYCDIHKLPYEDTDVIELFKLIYPDDNYMIINGEFKVKENNNIIGESWRLQNIGGYTAKDMLNVLKDYANSTQMSL